MIKISNINKYFNKGKQNQIHVINNASLELGESGMVAIFGRSGCGKTTLLNVIGGLDTFESGSLSIDGQSVKDNADVIRNKYIGYIFQNYNLNKGASCYDNVADALRLCGMTDEEKLKERVMAALANVGMENYHSRTPDTLSGGQQQRIAIARAIVKNPRIILADEPTGNLDEANTVMIMDLLKEISREHLVLLVTHEANLVDYYCDTVVELSDGKVQSVRSNSGAEGYAARSKNDIYLGELERTDISDGNAKIEFYGNAPDTPVSLTIVNDGGKLYVRINTPKVQILDAASEVKLREGVYEEETEKKQSASKIDMSKLPVFEGTRFGRLFGFKSAVKSGYSENFKKGKRRRAKKVLRGCLALFAAVVVFMSAVFGTALADIKNARDMYNHNVFYVYTPDAEVSRKLADAVGGNTGIDSIRLTYSVPRGDSTLTFMTGFFESFSTEPYESGFMTNAVYLDMSVAEDCKLVAGKNTGLSVNEIVISTKVADALIEKSSLGYIDSYDSLIGLITATVHVDGRNMRIAGVVESNESAIYFTELAMAKFVMSSSGSGIELASDYGLELDEGEAAVAVKYTQDGVELPKLNKTVKLSGRDVTVSKIIKNYDNYHDWLKANGIEKLEAHVYFEELLKTERPDLSEGKTQEYYEVLDELSQKKYFDYLEYQYAELDEYLAERSMFAIGEDINLWLYVEKGIEDAKYFFSDVELYKAVKYKELNGRYPTREELHAVYDQIPEIHEAIEQYNYAYSNEYYSSGVYGIGTSYLVSDADYIAFSKQIGETDYPLNGSGGGKQDIYYHKDVSVSIIGGSEVTAEQMTSGGSQAVYTVIHSTDPAATEAWIYSELGGLDTGIEGRDAIITPDGIFDKLISQSRENIIKGLVAMVVILVVMSVCMYFIMRSSLMNRIKEVGIYRAIGVSKRNLLFKFFIEALVLTTLTVFIGYLATSAFLGVCLGMSSMMESIFYYPLWLAGVLLAVLYGISIFFGTLPVISLMRKTPSEILAKYDI